MNIWEIVVAHGQITPMFFLFIKISNEMTWYPFIANICSMYQKWPIIAKMLQKSSPDKLRILLLPWKAILFPFILQSGRHNYRDYFTRKCNGWYLKVSTMIASTINAFAQNSTQATFHTKQKAQKIFQNLSEN